LGVLDSVTNVDVVLFEQVHHWEDLTVVGHQSFSDGVRAGNQNLQNFKSNCDNLGVTGVQSSLDWDDKLGNDGQNLGSTFLKHIKDTLDGQETVGILLLSDALKEDWQVVMVVELHDIDLPEDLVWWAVFDSDREISAIVETSEFRWDNST